MKRLYFGFFLIFSVATTNAQTIFIGLSPSEQAELVAGNVLTRIAKNVDALAIPPTSPGAQALLDEVRSLKPNYLVETMAILEEDGKDLGGALGKALSQPGTWLGIPYYSQRKGKRYDLFDKCIVRSRSISTNGELVLEVLHHMLPFDDYASKYELISTVDSIVFSGINITPLVYKKIKAVEPGNMTWRISAWRNNGTWNFYGVGAVKAFDLFGAVRDRLEPSFIGRTEAFFDYMHGRLE